MLCIPLRQLVYRKIHQGNSLSQYNTPVHQPGKVTFQNIITTFQCLSKIKKKQNQKLQPESVYVSVSWYVQTDHQAWGTNQVQITPKRKGLELVSEIHPTFGNDICIKKSHQYIKKISLVQFNITHIHVYQKMIKYIK